MTNMNQDINKKRDYFSVCIFLFLFPLLLLIIDFSFQKIPGNYTSLYNNPIWIEGKLINYSSYKPDEITDCSRYISDYLYLSRIRSFSSLLWDNTSGPGTPFLARWESRAFSIFSIPFYFLSLWQSIYLSIWLKMVVAGIGVYLLTMSLGLLPSIGLFIAVIFQTSGPLFYIPIHSITDVIVWFPYYLCLINLVLYNSFRYWILLCPVILVMALGGNLEVIGVTLIFTIFYLIISHIINRITGNVFNVPYSSIAFIILSWIISAGLLAFQIFPYLEWNSYRANSAPFLSIPRIGIKDLLGLFFPANVTTDSPSLISLILLFSPGICLILLFPLWISAHSLLQIEKKNKIDSFFITSLCVLILFLIKQYFNFNIPYIDNLSLLHSGWLLILSTGFIIGIAIEAWNIFSPDECRECTRKLVFIAIPLWIILFILVIVGKYKYGIGTEFYWKELKIAILSLILVLIYLSVSLFYPSPRNAGYIVSMIILLFVTILYLPYRPTTHVELLNSDKQTINKLNKYGTRFAGPADLQNTVFPTNGFNLMVIPEEKSTERYSNFMRKALADPKLWFRTGTSCFILTSPMNNNVDNSFFQIRQEVKLADIFSSGMAIFKSENPAHRAFVIYNGKSIDKPNMDLLSSDLPHLVENAPIPETTAIAELPATVEDISSTHVRVNVEKTKPGILVLADTYYPGWSVSVDGVLKDIIPVNIAFRGVELSEGDHQIDFEYHCKGFWVGLTISIISLIIYLIIIRFSFHFQKQFI